MEASEKLKNILTVQNITISWAEYIVSPCVHSLTTTCVTADAQGDAATKVLTPLPQVHIYGRKDGLDTGLVREEIGATTGHTATVAKDDNGTPLSTLTQDTTNIHIEL